MEEIMEHNKNQKKEKRQTAIAFFAVVLFVTIGILIFLRVYNKSIDKTLYDERLNQMREVTTQLFSGLEDVVKNEWRVTEEQNRMLQKEEPETLDALVDFMVNQTEISDLSSIHSNLVAVDENGWYYTQAGRQGMLSERRYLGSEPEQISYVSNDLIGNDPQMVFLKKLEKPVSVQDDADTITLIYYGIAQNMKELNPYFECKAYSGANSVYVVDEDGLKLFSSSAGDLLKGYNVFSALKNMEYLHDSSFDETREEFQENNIAYSNAKINDTEIYYALYKMENSAWTIIFMVPSSYVAVSTVTLVNNTEVLVLAFAIIMIVLSTVVIFWLSGRQRKMAVLYEKANNERLEKLNKKLEAASKAKTDFLANMSHDIRTPMNAIVGITSLMEHEEGISDKLHEYIEKVQLSSRHLLGLINDILDMSRIESKEVTLNVERVSLAEQVEQIDTIIRTQVIEHKHKFHIRVNGIVHEYLLCDGVRLRQILLNLLSNAVKYTPDGGDIVFELIENPCEISDHAKFTFIVTDNGYGMSQEFLKHIFEPFTRVENSMTNKVQGTGLGMAITKNIVKLMGGEIHVQSELGKGSRFEVTVTLPVDTNAMHEIGAERILLVSDEELLIQNMKTAMSENSAHLFCLSTEKEAAEWLTQESTDVILLADCLKYENLRKTTAALRSLVKKSVLIFGVEDVRDENQQEILMKGGIDGIIQRPVFLSDLALAIARTRTDFVSENENTSILNGMNFLCAEDNELNAEILKEILAMYGASCTIYPDGEEIVRAFKDIRQGEYDAVLMDIQMPKMNGLEAAKAIRSSENPLGKVIPIIAMTANAFSEDVQHCLEAGMDAHIAKPIDIAVVEKTLRGLAGGGR